MRWRRSGNRFFPTPGQLIELCDSPYADKHRPSDGRITERDGHQPWGGACDCERCRNKAPREGFNRASPEAHAQANYEREQLDAWFRDQQLPSRLDAAEYQTRRLLVDVLVDRGVDREDARRKVMVDRTKILYPEYQDRKQGKASAWDDPGVHVHKLTEEQERVLAEKRRKIFERAP